MAISLLGAESYFTRVGRMFGGINECCTLENTTSTNRASLVASGFSLTDRNVIDGLYTQLSTQRSANSPWVNYLANLAGSTLVQMFLDNTPPIVSADKTTAVKALISQMNATSQTIQKPTISLTPTAGGSNVGNGFIVASYIDAVDGQSADYLLAETLTATVTADGYTGGSATAGSEPWQVVGQIPASTNLDWNWPAGSGANTSVLTNNAAVNAIVTNGTFDSWSLASNPPDNWTVGVGTMTSTIVRAAIPYTGAYSLSFVGNGSELTSVRQTLTRILPNTVYHFGAYVRSSGGVAAGVLQVRLINAASGAVITDNAGNASAATQSIPSLTTSYQSFGSYLLTPAVLPASVAVEIRLSTALTNAAIVYIDSFQIAAATQVYLGGPYLSFWAGSTPFAKNDTFSIVAANNATTSTLARSMDRVFNLRQLGLKIPSSNSPSVPDNVIF